MKRIRIVLPVCLALCLLAGCGDAHEPETQTQTIPASVTETSTEIQTTEPVETTIAVPKDLPPVDVDLTQMPQNLMYSQAYDMIYNSEQYLGKTVRILGPYSEAVDPETNEIRHACLIRDATACCTQGLMFEPADETHPLPAQEETIIVSGVFDTFMSGPYLYCVLRNAKIEA